MASNWPARIAGGAAGLANGLFGGGGGMVFLPILSRFGTLEQRRLYATCVGVIFPVSFRAACSSRTRFSTGFTSQVARLKMV